VAVDEKSSNISCCLGGKASSSSLTNIGIDAIKYVSALFYVHWCEDPFNARSANPYLIKGKPHLQLRIQEHSEPMAKHVVLGGLRG